MPATASSMFAATLASESQTSASQQKSCPITGHQQTGKSECPVDHGNIAHKTNNTLLEARCPVDHRNMTPEQIADYVRNHPMLGMAPHPIPQLDSTNDMTKKTTPKAPVTFDSIVTQRELAAIPISSENQMPQLPQTRAEGQTIDLPTERTDSSIPRVQGAETRVWEYPSPQQFYNALKRKGFETPEDEIEMMVEIHNFLNEASWNEVLKWERRFHCDCNDIRLANFRGRPKDTSPKSWFLQLFGGAKPFDRHDWTVDRCGEKVRYVVDYYSLPDEEPGVPAFNVDVRPAVDSFGSTVDRLKMFAENMYSSFFAAAPSMPTVNEQHQQQQQQQNK